MSIYTFGSGPPADYGTLPHSHSSWEILYYYQGNVTLWVDNQPYEIGANTIVCQPPNLEHSESTQSGFKNMYFYGPDFLPPNAVGVSIYEDDAGLFESVMALGCRVYQSGLPNRQMILEKLCKVIYEYLCAFEVRKYSIDPLIRQIQESITAHYTDANFDLNAQLKKIGYSPDYLRRYFKDATGISPHKYLLQTRIGYAKKLMETTAGEAKLSVKEVAKSCGFDDPYYFSKVFKKLTGKSPSESIPTTTKRRNIRMGLG